MRIPRNRFAEARQRLHLRLKESFGAEEWVAAIESMLQVDSTKYHFLWDGPLSYEYSLSPMRAVMQELGICIACVPRRIYQGIVLWGKSPYRDSMDLVEFLRRSALGDDHVGQ